jgi:hypothetical protein
LLVLELPLLLSLLMFQRLLLRLPFYVYFNGLLI